MKGIKRQSRHLRRVFASLLVLTLVVATMLYPDAMHPGDEAYAETVSGQVTLTSSLKALDNTTTDKVAFTISVGANATEGVSGIQFKVSYPEQFDLVSYTAGSFFDKGVSFFGETTETKDGVITYAANPFFCGVGSHKDDSDANAEKVTKESGDLVTLVFEANTTLNTVASYSFDLVETDTEAFLLAADSDSGPSTTYYEVVTTDVAKTYTPDSGTGSGKQTMVTNETVKVTPKTGTNDIATAAVKKQAVDAAIENANNGEQKTEIVIDASTDTTTTTEAKSELTLAKESMAAVAKAEKSIQIKTDAGQLTFSKEAAESIGKTTGGEKLVIETKKQNTVTITESGSTASKTLNVAQFTVTAKLVDSSDGGTESETPVTSFDDGEVTVSLDLPSGLTDSEQDPIKCWNYDLANKNYTPVNGSVTDGKFVFTTTHFSDYIVGTESTLNAFKTANDLSEGVTVSGKVTSYNPGNVATVQLKQNDEVKYQATIAAGSGSGQVTQDFSIANVPAGTYDLVVTKAGHLTYTIKNVVVGNETLDLTKHSNAAVKNITLLAGDVNRDGMINNLDYASVLDRSNFNKNYTKAEDVGNVLADVNGDGMINNLDYAVILSREHFNKSASACTISY